MDFITSEQVPKPAPALDMASLARGLNPALRCMDPKGHLVLLYRLFASVEYLQRLGINTILSVGSGNGLLESLLVKKFPKLTVICVDPEPNKYNRLDDSLFQSNGLIRLPVLVKSGLEIVSSDIPDGQKFAVLFNWWYPGLATDADTLLHLIKTFGFNIQAVLSVCELAGGAGSQIWLNWLNAWTSAALTEDLYKYGVGFDHIVQGTDIKKCYILL